MPQFKAIAKGQRILNGYEIVTLPAGNAAVFNKHGSLVHSGDWDSSVNWLRRRALISTPPTPDPDTLAIVRTFRI